MSQSRFRRAMSKEIPEGQRLAYYTLSVVIVLAVAVLAVVLRPDPPRVATRAVPTGTVAVATITPAATVVPEDDPPRDALTVPAADRRAVVVATREFVSSYLPYSYGRALASTVRGATAALQDELAADPPRPVRGHAGKGATVRLVQPVTMTKHLASANAFINGDGRPYVIVVELTLRNGRWLVRAVGV